MANLKAIPSKGIRRRHPNTATRLRDTAHHTAQIRLVHRKTAAFSTASQVANMVPTTPRIHKATAATMANPLPKIPVATKTPISSNSKATISPPISLTPTTSTLSISLSKVIRTQTPPTIPTLRKEKGG